jgi:hypothetical protein
LIVQAFLTAAQTTYEAKLRLLARVLSGAAGEPGLVDDAAVVIESVKLLEPPHVEVLNLLAQSLPEGQRTPWSRERIAQELPHLAPALDALLQALLAGGLALPPVGGGTATLRGSGTATVEATVWRITPFSVRILNEILAATS